MKGQPQAFVATLHGSKEKHPLRVVAIMGLQYVGQSVDLFAESKAIWILLGQTS